MDSSSEQWKRHMSINLDTGLWQCFKSDNAGNFIGLYAKLENKTYQSARTGLLFEYNTDKEPEPTPRKSVQEVGVDAHNSLMTETGCIPISADTSCQDDGFLCLAWEYIYKRKLFNLDQDPGDTQFYLGTEGRWRNRLIIPFVDENKKVFFFQGRALDGAHPKYLSCEGIKASNILYPFQSEEPYVIVCEGPIDALSLHRQGINATCTMTNKPSEIQIKQLAEAADYSQMKIVVGYDNDKAGQEGLQKFEELRKKFLLDKIYVVHPSDEYKDWGEMHENSVDIKSYIEGNMSKLDFPYVVGTSLNKL